MLGRAIPDHQSQSRKPPTPATKTNSLARVQRAAALWSCKERLGVWGKEKLRFESSWFSFPQKIPSFIKAEKSPAAIVNLKS